MQLVACPLCCSSVLTVACEQTEVLLFDPISSRHIKTLTEAHEDCVNNIRSVQRIKLERFKKGEKRARSHLARLPLGTCNSCMRFCCPQVFGQSPVRHLLRRHHHCAVGPAEAQLQGVLAARPRQLGEEHRVRHQHAAPRHVGLRRQRHHVGHQQVCVCVCVHSGSDDRSSARSIIVFSLNYHFYFFQISQ